MKNLILAAFAVISLTTIGVSAANATIGLPHNAYQTGANGSR
jgi:hypothetical protein